MSEICLIVAMDRNNAIGRAGTMPWHLPADLAHFKATTLGAPIIMGRRTFDSIGRALPGRRNVVITRQPTWRAEGVEVCGSLEEALRSAAAGDAPPERVFVIGGGQIYAAALEQADELVITRVETEVIGADTWFPTIDDDVWQEIERVERPADERNARDLTFLRYRRRLG